MSNMRQRIFFGFSFYFNPRYPKQGDVKAAIPPIDIDSHICQISNALPAKTGNVILSVYMQIASHFNIFERIKLEMALALQTEKQPSVGSAVSITENVSLKKLSIDLEEERFS